MRIALGIEYDGSGFSGWQMQRGVRTIQPLIEQAVSDVADHPCQLHCAGRTDTGVHASYQVAHFDTTAERGTRSWVLGANSNLPDDISVLWARRVPEHFHARFSAVSRAYDYLIVNRRTRCGLWHGKLTWEFRPLDANRMAEAARHLGGQHDFSSFRARGCQSKHPVRTITRIDVVRRAGLVVVSVEANAFLQHMVRNIAGVLLEVGRGWREPAWAREVLEARRRDTGGVTAPPDGLYLTAVRYPAIFGLPQPTAFAPVFSAYDGPDFD